jgi:hypothetical protein
VFSRRSLGHLAIGARGFFSCKYGSNCGRPHWMGHPLRESGDVAHRVRWNHTIYIYVQVARPKPFHFAPVVRRETGGEKALTKSTASRHCSRHRQEHGLTKSHSLSCRKMEIL